MKYVVAWETNLLNLHLNKVKLTEPILKLLISLISLLRLRSNPLDSHSNMISFHENQSHHVQRPTLKKLKKMIRNKLLLVKLPLWILILWKEWRFCSMFLRVKGKIKMRNSSTWHTLPTFFHTLKRTSWLESLATIITMSYTTKWSSRKFLSTNGTCG